MRLRPAASRGGLQIFLVRCPVACQANATATKHLGSPIDTSQGSPGRSNRYDIRERIGEGSAGVVYRAFDRRMFTEVALKTFRFPLPDPEEVYRLKREFRSFCDISHVNIARLYDLEISERECFFTMELIEGQNFLHFVSGEAERYSSRQ
jgi:serine/threonine protein kinase